MTPFEDIIRQLGVLLETELHPDQRQSCIISFPPDELNIQIDLDTNGDRILIGAQLGRINSGPYRARLFMEALRGNVIASYPQGILAFSEKNDTLVLFQFLDLPFLTGEKLYQFLIRFREHGKIWKQAVAAGEIPQVAEPSTGSGTFGLKP